QAKAATCTVSGEVACQHRRNRLFAWHTTLFRPIGRFGSSVDRWDATSASYRMCHDPTEPLGVKDAPGSPRAERHRHAHWHHIAAGRHRVFPCRASSMATQSINDEAQGIKERLCPRIPGTPDDGHGGQARRRVAAASATTRQQVLLDKRAATMLRYPPCTAHKELVRWPSSTRRFTPMRRTLQSDPGPPYQTR